MRGLLLLLASLIAAPVAAKDRSDAFALARSCLFEQLDQPTRAALGAGLMKELDNASTDGGKEASNAVTDSPAGGVLVGQAHKCQLKYKWSDAQGEAAVGWSLLTAAEPNLRTRATAAKFDYDAVERTAAALSAADRAALLGGGDDDADGSGARLLAAAGREGILILANDAARGHTLGVIVGALIMVDKYVADLRGQ